jgi:hypothetical protein
MNVRFLAALEMTEKKGGEMTEREGGEQPVISTKGVRRNLTLLNENEKECRTIL